MFELGQLRCLVAVAEEPSFRRVPGDAGATAARPAARSSLAEAEEVGPEPIDVRPLITCPPVEGRYLRDLVAGLLRVAGAAPSRVQHIGQTRSVPALVRAGTGLALVPPAGRLRPESVLLRPLSRIVGPRGESLSPPTCCPPGEPGAPSRPAAR